MEGERFITNYQIRSNSIIVYDEYQGNRKKGSRNVFYDQQRKENLQKAYSGKMTAGARKRLQKAITILTQITPTRSIFNTTTNRYQKIKLNFITLTISDNTQNYTSRQAYKTVLRPLLQYLTRTCGMK